MGSIKQDFQRNYYYKSSMLLVPDVNTSKTGSYLQETAISLELETVSQ